VTVESQAIIIINPFLSTSSILFSSSPYYRRSNERKICDLDLMSSTGRQTKTNLRARYQLSQGAICNNLRQPCLRPCDKGFWVQEICTDPTPRCSSRGGLWLVLVPAAQPPATTQVSIKGYSARGAPWPYAPKI
jgi:hypothetical protein